MAKKAEQNRVKNEQGLTLEHNAVYDDSLLPSADELAKLNSISSDIVPWIMERTEKEQNARIKFNEDRMRLMEKDIKNTYNYNIVALIMAFLITIAFLIFSFYLVINGKGVEGTIFAGATVVMIVAYFIKAKNKEVK